MSSLIKIGVTACFMYPDVERVVFGRKSLSYFENDMFKYLTRKGVMPILIPDLEGELFEQYLNEMDAFVFQGGVDLAPETYGDEPIESGKWRGDAYRDAYELKIMDFAFKNNIATLDFLGVNSPNRADFKESFGGFLTSFYELVFKKND